MQDHIDAIKQSLNDFEREAHLTGITGDSNWTYGIKHRLMNLGWKHDYQVSAGGFPGECEPEWLYDMVWYREEGEGEDKRLTEVALVVESEWKSDFRNIKYDFEKLLVANASLRLMICQAKPQYKEDRMAYFKNAVAQYRYGRKGDTFLIALLDKESEKFCFEQVTKQ
jgi:hypothetical protein